MIPWAAGLAKTFLNYANNNDKFNDEEDRGNNFTEL